MASFCLLTQDMSVVDSGLSKQIAKQILLGLDYIRWFCGVIHTGTILLMIATLLRITNCNVDLRLENVLICIDDVEFTISSELAPSSATASAPPTRLIVVPPSKGQGSN